jgi:hypothetical protein
MRLSINGKTDEISSKAMLLERMAKSAHLQFREVWLNVNGGPALCALLNKNIGWLMYLREAGDAGFSSRNPAYPGSDSDVVQYQLSNGQVDEYPASWALSEAEILDALTYFFAHRSRPTSMVWHDYG